MTKRPVFHREIGRYLAGLRDAKGWSQLQTVVEAGKRGLTLRVGPLRFLEEGKTKHPDPDLLATIAKLYGISYVDLAKKFVAANYGNDLFWQTGTRDSSTLEASADVKPPVSDSARLLELEARHDSMLHTLEKFAQELTAIVSRERKARDLGRKESARRGTGRTAHR